MFHMASSRPTRFLGLGAVLVGLLLCCEATRSRCSVQSRQGVVRTDDICSFSFRPSKHCKGRPSGGGGERYGIATREVQVDASGNFLNISNCRSLDTSNSALDLSFTLLHSRRVMLVVSGVTGSGTKRCVTIEYLERPGWEATKLTLQSLPLPHGAYNATLLVFGGADPATSSLDGTMIGHQSFYVHHRGCPRKDKVQRRHRRVGDFPVPRLPNENRPRDPCHNCYDLNHISNDTGYLQFHYLKAPYEGSCSSECSNVTLELLKCRDVHSKADCYANVVIDSRDLSCAREEKIDSKGVVEYRNLETGCYLLKLTPLIYMLPRYSSHVWLDSFNIINMDRWNTTFNLMPNRKYRSLLVQWKRNSEYNFSKFELQLWHNMNHSISCRGDSTTYGTITSIPSKGKLIISSEDKMVHKYTFYNLSSGWYCARVGPIDDRCGCDACPLLSTVSRRLQDVEVIKDPPPMKIFPIAIGVVAVVVIAGIALACCVLLLHPTCRGYKSPSLGHKVNSQGAGFRDVQEILLVWTPYGPHGADFVPIITAFKKILQSYHCKVYDYLDLPSLPEELRHHLLQTPIAWVNTLLAKSNLKIIIVATEGAKLRQAEGMCPVIRQNHTDTPEDINPYDHLLFPYLQRYLQDRYDLAGDYSRIFHVRFSDVSDSSTELEGIVSWKRFRLPEHLNNLILSIHGLSEWRYQDEPTTEILRDLTAALAAHPLYGHCTSANLPNSIQRNNGTIDSGQPRSSIPVTNNYH